MTERENIMRVHVMAADVDTLRKALLDYRFSVAGGVRKKEDGQVGVDAYLSPDQLEALQSQRNQSIAVEVVEDATAVGLERQAEVGDGDRYEDGSLPEILGELTGGE